jgi:hypothetical protein
MAEIKPIKRFLMFSGFDYSATGGWGDFTESYDTLDEARECWAVNSADWCHIVDGTLGVVVEEFSYGKWQHIGRF